MPGVSLRFALAVLACSVAAAVHAQGTSEQREACAPDALKLCGATVPDVAKTAQCMKAHQADLSPRCKAAVAAAAPADVSPKTRPAPQAVTADAERPRARTDPRYIRDPDAEVSYTPPRRVIAPPRYGDPGPPLNPGGVPYDELFAGPSILDLADGFGPLEDPDFD